MHHNVWLFNIAKKICNIKYSRGQVPHTPRGIMINWSHSSQCLVVRYCKFQYANICNFQYAICKIKYSLCKAAYIPIGIFSWYSLTSAVWLINMQLSMINLENPIFNIQSVNSMFGRVIRAVLRKVYQLGR